MAFVLDVADVLSLGHILRELLGNSEADGCLVCDTAGHVLVHEGVSTADPLLVSALGAGVFAATHELASLLGEEEFSTVLHQGANRSLLICAANEDALLLVTFPSRANLGLIKLYAPSTASALRVGLEQVRARGLLADSEDRTFVLRDGGDIFGAAEPSE